MEQYRKSILPLWYYGFNIIAPTQIWQDIRWKAYLHLHAKEILLEAIGKGRL